MSSRIVMAMAWCVVLSLLAVAQPVGAVMVHEQAATVRSARPAGGAAVASAPSTNRDGVVQAIDLKAQTIVINGTRYIIGPPQLALLDKRPKSNGLLKFTDLKVGMVVRYRVENERVVELWVMRDPQTSGARP
jgi:hypothetical protein